MDRCFSTEENSVSLRTELYFVASQALFIYREKIRRIFVIIFSYVHSCSDESNKCFLIRERREEMKFEDKILESSN